MKKNTLYQLILEKKMCKNTLLVNLYACPGDGK